MSRRFITVKKVRSDFIIYSSGNGGRRFAAPTRSPIAHATDIDVNEIRFWIKAYAAAFQIEGDFAHNVQRPAG